MGKDPEAGVFLGLRDCEIRLSKGMAQRGELGGQALALGKGACQGCYIFFYTQIQNKSAKGKKKHAEQIKKQCFTSFIGGNAVHEFASGSYFSPELRVCLFSSWPPNTNKNPSAKIKGDI